MNDLLPIEDPVLIFALVAGLILLAPILLGRFRLPGMVGLLLAGAVLGPNAAGVLARDESFVLFGTVGLLYIMFMAALEVDLAAFKRYRVHGFVFGLVTFALPQGLGFLVAHHLLGFGLFPALLLGSIFASHTLLAYPIASRLGIAKGQAVTTAVGGTILTDTLALVVLAVVAGSTRGEMDRAFWYELAGSIAAYVGVVLFALPRLGRWFFRRVAQDGTSEFVFVLATVFGCASLSHVAGIEPIVGAFLAGLALNRLIPHGSTLMNRIQFTGEAVFVPFFLLSVGMLLDVRVFLGGLRSWVIAIGMLACVLVTKWLAAESLRLFLRFSRDEARLVFGLSVAQAAATLAATMVGYELGLFDEAVVNGAIMMILGTCILAPLVVDRYGRRLAAAGDAAGEERAGTPQRIMVALAKPSGVRPLVELAQILRDPEQAQSVYPLTVVEDGRRASEQVAQAEKMLAQAVFQLSAADVPASPLTRIALNVPAGILRARRELRGTEVVVGWAGRTSTTEFFFGSMLERLLSDPHYTLVVTRLVEPLNTCRRIVLVVPPGAELERSFPAGARLAKRLARRLAARLIVVSLADQAARTKKAIRAVKPSASFAQRGLESWSGLAHDLTALVGDGDMIVLTAPTDRSSRRGSTPGDLLQRLATHFISTNLLVVYPAEPVEVEQRAGEPDLADETGQLHFDHIVTDLEAASLKEALERLVAFVPGDGAGAALQELVPELLGRAEELVPGVVLASVESARAERRSVILGVSHEGLSTPAGGAIRVLAVLIDPPGRRGDDHLDVLAAIARIFRSSASAAPVEPAAELAPIAALQPALPASATAALPAPTEDAA